MADFMASVFIDVHPFKAKVSLFRNSNCFLVSSIVSAYTLRQMALRLVADWGTRSSRNAFYTRCSSRYDIMFYGMCAKSNRKLR